MSIAGKYVGIGEEGFQAFMEKEGFSQKPLEDIKHSENSYDIKVEGNKVIITHTIGDKFSKTTEYPLGEPVDERLGSTKYKSTAKLNGNNLTISAISDDGKERVRILKFSDTGLDVIHRTANGEGKLIFKRQ